MPYCSAELLIRAVAPVTILPRKMPILELARSPDPAKEKACVVV